MSASTLLSHRLVCRCLIGALLVGCFLFSAGRALAEDPIAAKKLILEPRAWELADLDKAQTEMDRLSTRQVERWKAWRALFQGTDAYIEEVRQRLLEEHARILAYDDVAQANYAGLCLPDGWVRFPMWGAYDGTSNKDALAASIAADKRRIAEELDTWKKGDIIVSFPFFPESSANGVKLTVADWDRKIADYVAVVKKGEARLGGTPWYFGSAAHTDLANLRQDSQRRWKDKEDQLNALGDKVSLREIGLGTVADIDGEIAKTRKELKDIEEVFTRKEYRIDHLGTNTTRVDTEKKIASWQQEISDRNKMIADGAFKVSFPGAGVRSRQDLLQENADLQKKIEDVDTVVKNEEYKIDAKAVGQVNAKYLRDVLAKSKDAAERAGAQDALRRIPIAAAMHKRYYELMILRNNQWMAAIPKMSLPAFVRDELDIQQANEFLAEFDHEWSLIKERSDRKLAWLARCRALLTGEKAGGDEADIDAIIAMLKDALQKLEALKLKMGGK